MKNSLQLILIASLSFGTLTALNTPKGKLQTNALAANAAFAFAAEQDVNAFVSAIEELPLKFTDRPKLDQLKDAACGALVVLVGAGFGHIATCAIINVLGGADQTPQFFQPSKWTTPVAIGTVAGAALSIYPVSYMSYKDALTKKIDKKLLTAVIAYQDDSAKLSKAIDQLFISSRFPRAMAFAQLNALRSHFADMNDLFELLTEKPYGDQIKELLPAIQGCLTALADAMLVVKNDPRWYEECNAQTLANSQANLQAHQNAQATSGLIQLAHMASR